MNTNTKTPACTCPSGDGSLTWPCPAHAPAAPQAVPDAQHSYVVYTRPGKVPERKGPYPTPELIEAALRELHAAHPDASSMVIKLSEHQWPQSGVEWIDMHGDKRKGRLVAAQPAAQPADAITGHDLSTSDGGRGYVAEYFAKRLRRHDFSRYITSHLAADFACVLARHLDGQPLRPAMTAKGAAADAQDAARYRWLRGRDLDTIACGGVFAGMTPVNVVLNGEDLDAAIDAARTQAGGQAEQRSAQIQKQFQDAIAPLDALSPGRAPSRMAVRVRRGGAAS